MTVEEGNMLPHIDGPLLVIGVHSTGKWGYTYSEARGFEHWRMSQLEEMKKKAS